MKAYLIALTTLTLVNCSNTAGTADNKSALPAAAADAVTDHTSGSCSNLIVFHEGAVIEGKNFDGKGNELSSQSTRISAVKEVAGVTIADADISYSTSLNKNGGMHIQYKCDGKKLSMDLASMMSNFSALKDAKTTATDLDFPINFTTGDKLPDATLTVDIQRRGLGIKTTVSYVNRKVEGKESVTTTAGTWTCYKITSDIVSKTDMTGGVNKSNPAVADMMNKQQPAKKSIIWFAPDFGLVRMDMYTGDELTTRTDITAVKK